MSFFVADLDKLKIRLAVLDQVKDGWEFVVDPDVRHFWLDRV